MLTEAQVSCLPSTVLVMTSQEGVFSIGVIMSLGINNWCVKKTLASASRFVTVRLSPLIYLFIVFSSFASRLGRSKVKLLTN